MSQWNIKGSPEVEPQRHSQLIFDKGKKKGKSMNNNIILNK